MNAAMNSAVRRSKLREMGDSVKLMVVRDATPDVEYVLDRGGKPLAEDSRRTKDFRLEEVFEDLDGTNPGASGFVRPADPGFFHHAQWNDEVIGGYRREKTAHPRNPLVVWTFVDLIKLAGPSVSVLFVLQVLSAVGLGCVLAPVLLEDQRLLIGGLLIYAWLANGIVFAFGRGTILSEWKKPMLALAVLTVVPGVLCLFWLKLSSLG